MFGSLEDIRIDRNNCFDALRYFFSVSLIIVHFCTLAGEDQFWIVSGNFRVKAFFIITGFLVTYSLIRRNDVLSFYKKRIARIMPAYLLCILFCFILGLIVTNNSFIDFLSSHQTWNYLLSNIFMLNWIEPSLPGVFTENIFTQMNGSLWSMKFEALYYLLVPLYIWIIKKTSINKVTIISLILLVSLYTKIPYQIQCCCFFLGGATILFYFNIIKKYIKIFLCLSIIILTLLYNDIYPEFLSMLFIPLEVFALSMLIIGIAYNIKKLNFLSRYDNISYGLYLYHFPIAQLIISSDTLKENIFIAFSLTFLLTIIVSLLSWYYIEKPILSRIK